MKPEIQDLADLGYAPIGTAMVIRGVYGRLLRREGNEFRGCAPILLMVTPDGTEIRSGLIWCRALDAEGLDKLRVLERGAKRLYAGKLDHIIGYTGTSNDRPRTK